VTDAIASKLEFRLRWAFAGAWTVGLLVGSLFLGIFLHPDARDLAALTQEERSLLWALKLSSSIVVAVTCLLSAGCGWLLGGRFHRHAVENPHDPQQLTWKMALCLPFIGVLLFAWFLIPLAMLAGISIPVQAFLNANDVTFKEGALTVIAVLVYEAILGVAFELGRRRWQRWYVERRARLRRSASSGAVPVVRQQ
jgi:hypothetical protein